MGSRNVALIAMVSVVIMVATARADESFRPFIGTGVGLPLVGISIADEVYDFDTSRRFVWRLPLIIGAEVDPRFVVFVRMFAEVVPDSPGNDITSLRWETGFRWLPFHQGLFLGAGLNPQRFALGVSGSLGYYIGAGPVRFAPELQVVSGVSAVPAWTTAVSVFILVEIPWSITGSD